MPGIETHAQVTRLLIDENQPAAIINAEMGTGKTIMGIAAGAVLQQLLGLPAAAARAAAQHFQAQAAASGPAFMMLLAF